MCKINTEMNEEIEATCPYCWELIIVEPEPSDEPVEYVEDCPVCCQPIVYSIVYSTAGSLVTARKENE